MTTKTKTVYYCDYCKKHGLSRAAMEKHETKCTLNPDRICGWGHSNETADFRSLAKELQGRTPLMQNDIAWLHDEILGDEAAACPACMLAALRQSGVEYHHDVKTGVGIWSYEKAIEDYRKAEREKELHSEYRAIEASFL